MVELRCSHCGDRIGVYEPLVAIDDGRARETSRAAEPEMTHTSDLCYHRTCFDRVRREDARSR